MHSFHSIKDENYKNILPPLTLLSEEKQKELMKKLNELKFIRKKQSSLIMILARLFSKIYKEGGIILIDAKIKNIFVVIQDRSTL